MMNILSRLWIAGLVSMLLVVFAVSPVAAHTEFVSSNPAAGAALASAPAEVSITFSGILDLAGSSIVVVDGNGTTVSQGATMSSPTDAKTIMVALQSGLGAGTYTVNWAAQSDDGHVSKDSFSFTVGTASQPSTSAPAQLPATGATPMMLPLLVLGASLLVLGGGIRTRRTNRSIR